MLADIQQEFRRHQKLAEASLAALSDDSFFARPGSTVNSVAMIVKHVAGNLRSRWTAFLASDGEKPDRQRDQEFVITERDTRDELMAKWSVGWSAVWDATDSLTDADLDRTVTIRGEPHTVRQALLRGLTHTAYHVGQILYLVRLFEPGSRWLTIAPGTSKTHNQSYLRP
jgi:uncharacterized damage-inducible protein DinB